MPNDGSSTQEVELRLRDLFEELSRLPDLPTVLALRAQAATCRASVQEATHASETLDAGLTKVVDQLAADTRVLRDALLHRPSRLRRHRI